MKLTVLSMFSHSEWYLPCYLGQVLLLDHHMKRSKRFDEIDYIWLEGNSPDDDTASAVHDMETELRWYRQLPGNIHILHEDVECTFRSVEIPERFQQLSYLWGLMWDRIECDDSDQVLLVESDLHWSANDARELFTAVTEGRGDILAPTVLRAPGDRFYDTWAFRYQGKRFTAHEPYVQVEDPGTYQRWWPIDSAGSMLAFTGAVAKAARPGPKEELVEFCIDARKAGFKVVWDKYTTIYHRR